MQIRDTIDNPSTASTESPREDAIVLVDSAGVALGVQQAFSAKTRAVRPGGVSIASRCVEIPLVGGNGQISGVLCQYMPPSDVRAASVSRGPGRRGQSRTWRRSWATTSTTFSLCTAGAGEKDRWSPK